MKLLPVDTPQLIDTVAEWLGKKSIYQWLDFGNGKQVVSTMSLKLMTQRDIHLIRVYTGEADDTPVGLVGLSNIDYNFKTAMAWCLRGNLKNGGHQCTRRAVSGLLSIGFSQLGLKAIHAWTVEINTLAIRIIEANHFQFVGRQRQCHYIDGRAYDRLLYDLLASEYKPS